MNILDLPLLLIVRTALVALIAFMPTSPNGALGSLDYKKEERRILAIKSREASPKFGTPERQKLIDEASFIGTLLKFSHGRISSTSASFGYKFLVANGNVVKISDP